MLNWILQIALDNIVPIILTMLLGLVGGLKIKHIKDAVISIIDAVEDGKIDKGEWKEIIAKVKAIIGR